MINLDDILQHAYNRLNKEQSGNTYGPDQYNQDLPFLFYHFLNKRYGQPINWRPGMPMPAFGFEVTQLMTDDLSELKVVMGGNGPLDPGALTVASNGYATLPSDYFHYAAMNGFYTAGECDDTMLPTIEVCTDQQFSNNLTHYSRNKFAEKEPYCNFQSFGIQFMPKNIGMVRFAYLRRPATPFYDYYTNVDTGQIFYLPVGAIFTATTTDVYRTGATSGTFTSQSVDLEAPEYLMDDFANCLVDLMSENLRSQFMKAVATGRETKDS